MSSTGKRSQLAKDKQGGVTKATKLTPQQVAEKAGTVASSSNKVGSPPQVNTAPAAERPSEVKPFSEVMESELAEVKQQHFTQGRIDAMKLLVGQQAYREGFTETVQAVGVSATPEEAERFHQTVTLTPGIDYDSIPTDFDPNAILASVSNTALPTAESAHALPRADQT